MRTKLTRPLASIFWVVVLIGAACSGGDQTTTALDDSANTTVAAADDSPEAGDDVTDSQPSADEAAAAERAMEQDHDEEAMVAPGNDATPAGDSDAPTTESIDGDAELVVAVEMNDFGYEIDETTIPVGSTVRFDFVNVGVVEHEAMFGTMHQQEEFAGSGGHGGHADEDADDHHGTVPAITLGPGDRGSLVVEFDEAGEIMIGCHLPGHWDAGMVTSLTVASSM